jgi:hypothetical protein
LNIGELLEVESQRASDRVERSVRLTGAFQVNVCYTVGKFEFTVACKAVQDQGIVLIAFHIAGAFEEFVQHSTDNVP